MSQCLPRLARAALAIAGAVLFAAEPARAEFPDFTRAHTTTFYGCSSDYAAVFGPGPRLCVTVQTVAGPDETNMSAELPWAVLTHVSAAFTAPWLWNDCGNTGCGPVFVGVPGMPPNDDALHAPTCTFEFACAPGATSFNLFPLLVEDGFVPFFASVDAYVFDPREVAPGQRVFPFGVQDPLPGVTPYAVHIDLTAIPEPATTALTAGGLLVLAGIARRRR